MGGEALAPLEDPGGGRHGELGMLAVLGRLRSEMGGRAQTPGADSGLAEPCTPASWRLGREEDQFVIDLRQALLALVASRLDQAGPAPAGLRDALDGAEYVARSDIYSGEGGRLAERLPSFVFLALLPVLGRAEAVAAATRARQLSLRQGFGGKPRSR